MNMTQLSPNLFVGPQIYAHDLEHLKRQGFTDVVCNRPDAEHPEGAVSQDMADMAQTLDLTFHYLPIPHGAPIKEQAQTLRRLSQQPDARIFAYCRSGARSANCWETAKSDVT